MKIRVEMKIKMKIKMKMKIRVEVKIKIKMTMKIRVAIKIKIKIKNKNKTRTKIKIKIKYEIKHQPRNPESGVIALTVLRLSSASVWQAEAACLWARLVRHGCGSQSKCQFPPHQVECSSCNNTAGRTHIRTTTQPKPCAEVGPSLWWRRRLFAVAEIAGFPLARRCSRPARPRQ